MLGPLVARETELARLREFLAAASSPRALVLTGEPGIGKTALWEAGIDAARELGLQVVMARPSEARHSFAGLIDLFDGVAPRRPAGAAAVRARGGAAASRAGRHAAARQAIAMGVLNKLRWLTRPLLVAIDDLQWLDPASAEALAFAATRLADEPVAFLLARRPGRRPPLEQVLGGERLEVGPLDLDATRRLLAQRLGLSVPRPLMRRVAGTTQGNPLFALEVGRALVERGLPEIGEEIPLPDAVEDMLGTRVASLPDAQRPPSRPAPLLPPPPPAPAPLERLEVGPLASTTRAACWPSGSAQRPRPLMRRIADTTLGNPLFALEIGRALPSAATGDPAAGRGRGHARHPRGRPAGRQRRILLAVALSGDLRAGELAAVGGADAVEDAVDAGLLRTGADRIRASHPLLGAAARKHARPREERELHLALAQAVAGEERRARHLALAAQEPDAALADTVAAAADGAAARGAAVEAVELAEQALRLTPAGRPERAERLLALAHQLETAGERRRVTELLTPELAGLPAGRPRVHAWLLLANGSAVTTYHERREHFEHALAEAGADPALRAHALASMALSTAAEGVERIGEVEAWAQEALAADAPARVERLALRALGWAHALRGRPIDDVCERFLAASPGAVQLIDSPEPVAGLRLVWRGELERARAILTRFLDLSDERGESVSYAWMRLNLCELGLRAADWATVSRLLDEWAESGDEELLITPTYQRCRALVAAGRGLAGEARRWATPALEAAEPLGFRWQVLESHRALGIAALLAHEPATAAEHLRAVWEHTLREGVDEPGAFPVAPELVAGAGGARRARRGAVGRRPPARAGRGAGAPVGAGERRALRRRRAARRRRRGGGRRPGAGGGRLRAARPARRRGPLAARARAGAAAAEEVGRRARRARARRRPLRGARLAGLGGGGALRARARRRAAADAERRADAGRAARGRAGRRRQLEQGDRARAVRERAHRRGASHPRLREARRPLARAARAPAQRAGLSPDPPMTRGFGLSPSAIAAAASEPSVANR